MILFEPAHPGELIRETLEGFREETGEKLTIAEVAEMLGTSRKTLSAIINCRQSVTTEMAIRLGAGLPNTTPEFWVRVQENYDLAQALKRVDISRIRPIGKPKTSLLPL